MSCGPIHNHLASCSVLEPDLLAAVCGDDAYFLRAAESPDAYALPSFGRVDQYLLPARTGLVAGEDVYLLPVLPRLKPEELAGQIGHLNKRFAAFDIARDVDLFASRTSTRFADAMDLITWSPTPMC